MAHRLRNILLGGAIAAGAGAWAVAPRSFNSRRTNYVSMLPEIPYAHRGLHDAGSGLNQQYAGESGEYVALARRMAMQAGYGTPKVEGPLAPENSLAAFAAAAIAGYGIELDVQMTADNQIVVVHDADLLRVAGDPRRIEELTYDELMRIPLFPGGKPGDETAAIIEGAVPGDSSSVTTPAKAPRGYFQHVPLLLDVLRVVNGRVPIIVEAKFNSLRAWNSRDEELMQRTFDLLDAYHGEYVVESFNPAALRWVRDNHPGVCRGQLAEGASLSRTNVVAWAAGNLVFNWISRPDFIAYDHRDGANKVLAFERSIGAQTVAWTVRSTAELDASLPYFDRYIFESFVPGDKKAPNLQM